MSRFHYITFIGKKIFKKIWQGWQKPWGVCSLNFYLDFFFGLPLHFFSLAKLYLVLMTGKQIPPANPASSTQEEGPLGFPLANFAVFLCSWWSNATSTHFNTQEGFVAQNQPKKAFKNKPRRAAVEFISGAPTASLPLGCTQWLFSSGQQNASCGPPPQVLKQKSGPNESSWTSHGWTPREGGVPQMQEQRLVWTPLTPSPSPVSSLR